METDHLKQGVDDLREKMIDQLAYIAVNALKEKAFIGMTVDEHYKLREQFGDVLRGWVRP